MRIMYRAGREDGSHYRQQDILSQVEGSQIVFWEYVCISGFAGLIILYTN